MKSSKLFFLLSALLVVSTSFGTAQWGNCTGFDGSTGYVSTAASSTIAVPTAVTIEAMIKPSHTGDYQEVVRLRGTGYDDGCEIQIQDDGSVQFNANLPTNDNHWCTVSSFGVNVFDGAWHHVAGVVDASNNAYLYVDGVHQGTATGWGPIALDGNGYIYVGLHTNGQHHYMGLIDEVRISNNVRYTGESYTVPTSAFTPDGNTLLLFHFDESNSTTATDASGNGNAGTLNGGAFFTAGYAAGNGSSGNPYQVATADQLNLVRAFPSAYFKQTSDIDLNVSPYKDGDGWAPIGNSTIKFTGNYDGNGHTISGLTISSTDQHIGLFGYISGSAAISNLGITGASISGYHYTGILAGWCRGTTTVSQCFATGTVTSTSGSSVGGLVGEMNNDEGATYISNCYFVGTVSAVGNTGGLMGFNYGTVSYCYASATVTGGTPGGLLGNSTTVSSTSFYNSDLCSSGSSYATGKTTTELQTASTFLDAGWNGSIWNIDATKTINNGYPYLKWQNTSGTPIPVELTSFTATTDNLNAKLSWKTATEVNNYGFNIERRMIDNQNPSISSPNRGGLGWGCIGFVQGNGTSNSPKEYSYIDASVASGTYAYRLKQIDNTGAFKYSQEAEVTVVVPKVFALSQNFPNPFNPNTTINFTIAEDSYVSLRVYDMLGREVQKLVDGEMKAGEVHNVLFDASKLSSGLYFYRLETRQTTGGQAGKNSMVKKLMLLK
jgi:hypothetical protein